MPSTDATMSDVNNRKRSAPTNNNLTSTTTKKAASRINTITPKVVKHSSKNRRKCSRTHNPSRDLTPERRNCLQYNHAIKTRVTLKLTLPHHDQMLTPFKSVVEELLQQIHQIDEHAEFKSWKVINDHLPHLSASSEPLNSLQEYKQYFNKLYFPKNTVNGITIYPNIYLGHDMPLDELREGLSDWLREKKHGLYHKMLQEEESSNIGWFLWSARNMDAGALADEIADTLGFLVGLRWKTIDTGVRGKIATKNISRALLVEVATKDRFLQQRALLNFYARDKKDINEYPNGIRLRFVKLKKDCVNAKEKAKVDKLRERQRIFTENICSIDTNDIVQIDYAAAASNEPTLRQMIMSINSKDTTTPLFHCVDLDWRGQGYTFMFSPKLQEEAECMIFSLPTFLQHHYPDVNVTQHFTSEAIERNEGLKYDEVSQMVIDPSSHNNNDNENDNNLKGFEVDLIIDITSDHNNLRPSEIPNNNGMPNDDDSVSTLGVPLTPSMIRTTTSPTTSFRRSPSSSSAESISSNTSTVTMESITSLQSQLETLSTRLMRQENDTQKKFDTLIGLMSSNQSNGRANHSHQGQDNTGGGDSAGAGL